jgi:ferritin-like metal-binding protein YciE
MEDLHPHLMQVIYYAEQQTLKALDDYMEKATNRGLTAALKSYRGDAETQIARLEQGFELMGKKPKGTACPAIDGILKEAKQITGNVAAKPVLDAALLATLQAITHYEIARYGTLTVWSTDIGNKALSFLLSKALKDKKAVDKELTLLAGRTINAKAAN